MSPTNILYLGLLPKPLTSHWSLPLNKYLSIKLFVDQSAFIFYEIVERCLWVIFFVKKLWALIWIYNIFLIILSEPLT